MRRFLGKKAQDIYLKPWRWKNLFLLLTCFISFANIFYMYSHPGVRRCRCDIANILGCREITEGLPMLYLITPTYTRLEQEAELTRLSQTLRLVNNLIWLVVEDSEEKSELVKRLLKTSGVAYVHLTAPMPAKHRAKKIKPKGVSNRNRGLLWIRENAVDGVVYFADDDNTYHLDLFEEMRSTKKVSMWPVGLVTKEGISSPIVKNGQFKGFFDGWVAKRKFPVDMAGFAVSVKFLLQRPYAMMPYVAGYEEDGFLKSLAPFEPEEIELKANNCMKILVWHTKTISNKNINFQYNLTLIGTNIAELKYNLSLSKTA